MFMMANHLHRLSFDEEQVPIQRLLQNRETNSREDISLTITILATSSPESIDTPYTPL